MKNWTREKKEDPYSEPATMEEYFEVQSLKTAIWQYMIDHAKVVDDEGLLKFSLFYMPSEEEFWRRVKARKDGVYKRTDLLKIREQEHKKHKSIKELRVIKNKYFDLLKGEVKITDNRLWDERINNIKKSGTLYQKLAMKFSTFLRKCARAITRSVIGFDK